MSEEEREDKGFRVTDRRIRFDEEKQATASEGASCSGATPSATKAQPAAGDGDAVVEGPGWQMEKKPDTSQERTALPPMDFTQFCLSLASSALIHLGEASDPETGTARLDLPLAKQTIDVLAMLEDKTRGNLSDAESKLLSAVLYDLRMRFFQKSGSAAPKKD